MSTIGKFEVTFECEGSPAAVALGGGDLDVVITSGETVVLDLDQGSFDWLHQVPGREWSPRYSFKVEALGPPLEGEPDTEAEDSAEE